MLGAELGKVGLRTATNSDDTRILFEVGAGTKYGGITAAGGRTCIQRDEEILSPAGARRPDSYV